ncbi:hypothetical protein HDV57DRAFT_500071 [Trichoderma longibrachiatum]
MACPRLRDGRTSLCQLELLGCWAWVHGSWQFFSPAVVPQVQSLRYSCVSTSRCSPIFLWSLILSTLGSICFFLFLSRRVRGRLRGKLMRLACGWERQTLGVGKPRRLLHHSMW